MINLNNLVRKELLGKGGIYIIRNSINKKVYIGSTKNFYNRLIQHRNSIIGKYSGNIKLMNFINYHSITIDNLSVELIEITSKSRLELYDIEREYIIKYNSVENGFNCSYDTVVAQVPFTDERKRKIGEKSKGRKMSNETKIKLSISSKNNKHNSKLKEDEVILIKKMLLLNYKPSNIIKLYNNINIKTIYNIKEGSKWNSIKINNNDITDEDIENIKNLLIFHPTTVNS